MLSILTIKLSIDIDNIMSVISAILLTPSKAPIQQSAWLLKTRERENISNICTVYSKVINSFVEIYRYIAYPCVSNMLILFNMKIVLPCYSMLYSLVPFMFLLTSRSCLASLAPRAAVATWRPPLGGLATSDLRHEDV